MPSHWLPSSKPCASYTFECALAGPRIFGNSIDVLSSQKVPRIDRLPPAQAQDTAREKSLLTVWRKLVGSLELLPAQKVQIAELRGVFLAKTATTQQRRSAAAQQLAETLPQGDFYHQGGFRYVKAAEALELLQQTLRDQHIYDIQVRI